MGIYTPYNKNKYPENLLSRDFTKIKPPYYGVEKSPNLTKNLIKVHFPNYRDERFIGLNKYFIKTCTFRSKLLIKLFKLLIFLLKKFFYLFLFLFFGEVIFRVRGGSGGGGNPDNGWPFNICILAASAIIFWYTGT